MDNQNQNSWSSLVAGLFSVGIIGLAIGILYAPQSGRETREMLMKTAGEAKDSALEMVGNAQDKADDIVRKARETKDKLVNAATAATAALQRSSKMRKRKLMKLSDRLRNRQRNHG